MPHIEANDSTSALDEHGVSNFATLERRPLRSSFASALSGRACYTDHDRDRGACTMATTGIDDIRPKLASFIKTHLARNHAGVDIDTESLVESGIIDSLGILKLVEFVEKDLGIVLRDDELLPENFDNLDAIAHLLSSKRH
jgi:acyl carrier protein